MGVDSLETLAWLLLTFWFCLLLYLIGRLLGPGKFPNAGSTRSWVFLLLSSAVFWFTAVQRIPGFISLSTLLFAGLAGRVRGEEKRKRSFDATLPRSSILYGLTLLLILLLAVLSRGMDLGTHGLILDEPWHLGTAMGYLETGDFRLWDFFLSTTHKNYPRAWAYTAQVAGAVRSMGLSLGVARLPSLLWGLLLFVPAYLVCRTLRMTRLQIIVALLWFALSPFAITAARWVRHYAMFVTLHLTFLVLVYYWLRARSRSSVLFLLVPAMAVFGLVFHLFSVAAILTLAALVGFVVHELVRGNASSVSASLRTSAVPGIAVLLAVSIGLIFHGTNPLGLVYQLPWSELGLPGWTDLFYPTFLVREFVGVGLGGLVLAAYQSELGETRAERFWLYVLLVPLTVTLFNSRPMPQIRYVGHLIAISIPLSVLALDRLVARLSPGGSYRHGAIYLILLVVLPVGLFVGNLSFVRAGHSGYVAFPGKESKQYHRIIDLLPRIVPPDRTLVLLGLPSYHAMQLKKKHGNVLYQSFFEKRWGKDDFLEKAGKPERAWVLSVIAYRDPLSESLHSYLEGHHRRTVVNLPDGVTLYRPLRKPSPE